MNSIKVFSPAGVSNVCCGFDVLGFSIAGLGDELIITESDSKKVNIITNLEIKWLIMLQQKNESDAIRKDST